MIRLTDAKQRIEEFEKIRWESNSSVAFPDAVLATLAELIAKYGSRPPRAPRPKPVPHEVRFMAGTRSKGGEAGSKGALNLPLAIPEAEHVRDSLAVYEDDTSHTVVERIERLLVETGRG